MSASATQGGHKWRGVETKLRVKAQAICHCWSQTCRQTFAGRSHLRSAVKECLVTSYWGPRTMDSEASHTLQGPALWNSLTPTVRDSSMSLTKFCTRLKTVMFCRAHDRS